MAGLRVVGSAWCLLAAGVAAGAPDSPDPPALVALSVRVSNPAGASDAVSALAVFDRAARLIPYAGDLAIVPRSEMFGDGEGDLGRQLRACGAKLECSVAALRARGVGLGFEITVSLAPGSLLVSTHLIDAGTAAIVGFEVAEPEPTAKSVQGTVHHQLIALLEQGGRKVGGALVVHTDPADAVVRVDDGTPASIGPVTGSPLRLSLPVGEHTVYAARDGYLDARTSVRLARAEDTEIRLTLEERSILASPWLWVAVGAVVAGTTAALAVALGGEEVAICHARAAAQCP